MTAESCQVCCLALRADFLRATKLGAERAVKDKLSKGRIRCRDRAFHKAGDSVGF